MNKVIFTGLGAILTGVVLGFELNFEPVTTGLLSAGLYWLNCT